MLRLWELNICSASIFKGVRTYGGCWGTNWIFPQLHWSISSPEFCCFIDVFVSHPGNLKCYFSFCKGDVIQKIAYITEKESNPTENDFDILPCFVFLYIFFSLMQFSPAKMIFISPVYSNRFILLKTLITSHCYFKLKFILRVFQWCMVLGDCLQQNNVFHFKSSVIKYKWKKLFIYIYILLTHTTCTMHE